MNNCFLRRCCKLHLQRFFFLVVAWKSFDVFKNQFSKSFIGIYGKNETIAKAAGNYMFKVNNRNTTTRCETCSKLTIKTLERCVSLLLTLNIFYTLPSVSIVNFGNNVVGVQYLTFLKYPLS